jgi:hypothetical protein
MASYCISLDRSVYPGPIGPTSEAQQATNKRGRGRGRGRGRERERERERESEQASYARPHFSFLTLGKWANPKSQIILLTYATISWNSKRFL